MGQQQNMGRLLLAIGLLMLAFAVKGWLVAPPSAPVTVKAGQFDTGRAVARLERILGDQRPHPVDTSANDAVRNRLIGELRAIGLRPEIREATDCRANPRARVVSCSHVRNVVASIGPAAGPRLLLNAHYDSTPAGPGAADDGIGVATLLEVAGQLRAKPPVRPVTFLFNEGEEYGLNGASAFARHDPLAPSVDSLINIESRGVSGAATMFETNAPNGPAIAAYARATRRPNANSISTDMAALIPNTTDVQVFKEKGWMTLSYAIIGNETRYHSPGDTVATLDRGSAAQMGSEVLAATRAMVEAPRAEGGSRMVFTDIAGLFLIALPLLFAAALLAALLLVTLFVARQRNALGRPLLTCAAAWTGAVAAAALAATLFNLIRPGAFWRAEPLPAYLAIYAVIIVVETMILARLALTADLDRRRAAAWTLTLLLGVLASVILPGATIYFLAAPGLALAALLIMPRSGRAGATLIAAAALVQLLMFAQLLAEIEMLLVDGPLWAVAPLAALATLPVLVEVAGPIDRRFGTLMVGAAALVCVGALSIPRTTPIRPGGLTLDYLRDDVEKRADWSVSNGMTPLPAGWSRFGPWRKAELRNSTSKRWLAKAPLLPLPTPRAQVSSIVPDGNGRRITLILHRGGFDTMGLRFAKGVAVTAMGLGGDAQVIPTAAGKGFSLLRCAGRGCDGLSVELRFADRRPVKGELIGTAFALPPESAPLVAARPASHIPHYAPNSSVRIIPFTL